MNPERRPPDLDRYRESQPINGKGDTLMVKGEPGPIEKIKRIREYRHRVQAEERIVTFLERYPWLMQVLTDDQVVLLTRMVRSIVKQAVREDRARVREVLAEVAKFLPEDLTVPDPRDDGLHRLFPRAQPDRALTDAEVSAERTVVMQERIRATQPVARS